MTTKFESKNQFIRQVKPMYITLNVQKYMADFVIYVQLGMRIDELLAGHLVLTHRVHTLEHAREAT